MEKRRKLSRKIIRVLLTFMLLVTSMEVSVPAAPRITISAKEKFIRITNRSRIKSWVQRQKDIIMWIRPGER